MPKYVYGYPGYKSEKPENIAKAQLYNINASYKDLSAVCSNIRGMSADTGASYLEKALKMEIPVAYKRWNKRLGHRKELGGKKGRYPIKAVKYVLAVLKNAVANADSKSILNPIIIHASANKQAIYPRLQSKGLRRRSDYQTSRIEIILKAEEDKIEEEKTKKIVKDEKEVKEEKSEIEKGKKKEEKEEKKVGMKVGEKIEEEKVKETEKKIKE